MRAFGPVLTDILGVLVENGFIGGLYFLLFLRLSGGISEDGAGGSFGTEIVELVLQLVFHVIESNPVVFQLRLDLHLRIVVFFHLSIDLLCHKLVFFFMDETILPLNDNCWAAHKIFHIDRLQNQQKPSFYCIVDDFTPNLLRLLKILKIDGF